MNVFVIYLRGGKWDGDTGRFTAWGTLYFLFIINFCNVFMETQATLQPGELCIFHVIHYFVSYLDRHDQCVSCCIQIQPWIRLTLYNPN